MPELPIPDAFDRRVLPELRDAHKLEQRRKDAPLGRLAFWFYARTYSIGPAWRMNPFNSSNANVAET
jgi:hypothetical protein